VNADGKLEALRAAGKVQWLPTDGAWLNSDDRANQQNAEAALGCKPTPGWAPLPEGQRRDAEYLQLLRFLPRKVHESAWSVEDDTTLQTGLNKWHAGELQMPSQRTDPARFISHHIMGLKFSARECARKVHLMHRQKTRSTGGAAPAILQQADSSSGAQPAAAAESEEEDSDEEVAL
jgi:hypothetical protein